MKSTLKKAAHPPIKHWRVALIVFAILMTANCIYQYAKTPIHVLNKTPFSSTKSPLQTWDTYGPLFRQYANAWLTPAQLAALAQAESAGNPFAAPRWAFRPTLDITNLYGPPSTAFGLLQITRPTVDLISKKCENDCPYFWMMTRASAKDSIRLTALYHQIALSEILSPSKYRKLSHEHKTQLISVIHLCGPGAGAQLVKKKFQMEKMGLCHSENPKRYARVIAKNEKLFSRLSRKR